MSRASNGPCATPSDHGPWPGRGPDSPVGAASRRTRDAPEALRPAGQRAAPRGASGCSGACRRRAVHRCGATSSPGSCATMKRTQCSVNSHLVLAAEVPWGGFKGSGYGRDLSVYALDDCSRTKHVMHNHARRPPWPGEEGRRSVTLKLRSRGPSSGGVAEPPPLTRSCSPGSASAARSPPACVRRRPGRRKPPADTRSGSALP